MEQKSERAAFILFYFCRSVRSLTTGVDAIFMRPYYASCSMQDPSVRPSVRPYTGS